MTPAEIAAAWNERHPIGTPVTYWPGVRQGPGRSSRTCTPAWVVGGHSAVVEVDDYSGGLALTHVAFAYTPARDIQPGWVLICGDRWIEITAVGHGPDEVRLTLPEGEGTWGFRPDAPLGARPPITREESA